MPFVLDAKVKESFFDRARVVAAIEARERRALSRMGAFIRRRAITDVLRRRSGGGGRPGRDRRGRFVRNNRSSAPGQPPVVHSRDRVATLRNILFALGPDRQSVLVGPVKLNQVNTDWISLGSTTVPQLHEFGGVAQIEEERYHGQQQWFRRDQRRRASANKEYRRRRARYPARPFMGPALQREVAAGTVLGAFAGVRS